MGRVLTATACLLLALVGLPDARGAEPDLSIKITSPLGRTGIPERIRIVAQIGGSSRVQLEPVRFFVDSVLLGEDKDGPPYAMEWTDENPFEAREIEVEVRGDGAVARDKVRLEPLEILDVSEVSSVLLEVAVHDAEGRFISGLTDRDFTVKENGVPQTIDMTRQETMPATYTLLVDSSQSMSRRIADVRLAATKLVQTMRAEDSVVVAPFTTVLGALTGPTKDQKTVLDAIDVIGSRGGTAILNALQSVGAALPQSGERHAVILLTDGYDEHSTVSRAEALAAVKKLHATLYVIGIAGSAGISLKGERFLRDLAAETGGRAFFPARDFELGWVDQQISDEIHKRYLVSYTPINQTADGTWRDIDLAAADPKLRIRTRRGYRAPAPPPIRPSIEFTMMSAERDAMDARLEDLEVSEDGTIQHIDVFHEAIDPVSIVLALDSSGSMRKAAEAAQAAARTFVEAVRPEDKLAVAMFSDGFELAHDLTSNRATSLEALSHYAAKGGTALYDALAGSAARLKREKARRAVVLFSDGRDENNPGTGPGSVRSRDDAIRELKDSEAVVFAIGLGPNIDRAFLEQVASESGGEAYFPADVSELEGQYRRIIENLRRRYVISYTSTNSVRNGDWRTVQITSRVPGATVRSKGGYFAPEK
ncbi:MAG TPA: VWA domain-containing protein [Methylomirabilota bacterium]|nr:VWA domain-containing protein [Methylomirabilota bacterium]